MSKQSKFHITDEKQLHSIKQTLIISASALITILGLKYIATDLIAPILMAIFVAILIAPIYRWFRSKNYSKNISALLLILTLLGGMYLLFAFISRSFGILSENLSASISDFNHNLEIIAGNTNTSDLLTRIITEENIINLFGKIIGSIGNLLLYLLIIPILALMLVLQADSIPESMYKELIDANNAMERFSKFSKSIMIYIVGRAKVNLLTGLICYIAFTILGIEAAFLWGILIFMLSFIPYLGIIIAGVPPTLLAFADSGLTAALIVIGIITAVNLFTENVIEPYVQGKGNRISTATIIIAIIFWTWLLGPLGAILSVPLTVLMKMVMEDFQETRWIASLMEGNYEKTQSELTKKDSNWKVWKKLPFMNSKKKSNSSENEKE